MTYRAIRREHLARVQTILDVLPNVPVGLLAIALEDAYAAVCIGGAKGLTIEMIRSNARQVAQAFIDRDANAENKNSR